MEREREIEILTIDGWNKSQAIRMLETYKCIIFEDFEKFFNDYMKEWGVDKEEKLLYQEMVTKKKPMSDWGIVVCENKTYYIQYIL